MNISSEPQSPSGGKNSPGQRPIGVCDHTGVCAILDPSFLQCRDIIGQDTAPSPDPRRCFFGPWALQGSIHVDFWTIRSDIEKSSIFDTLQNRPKIEKFGSRGLQGIDFGPKIMDFGVPFLINFSINFEIGENAPDTIIAILF